MKGGENIQSTPCNLLCLPCRDSSVQLEIYNLLKTVVHNIQGRIEQATCFDLLNHHQPLIKNVKKTIVEEKETNLMSIFIKFYFTASMLNMFRTLIYPSSRACDFSIVSSHWSCVLVSMCVGVSVWLVGVVSV